MNKGQRSSISVVREITMWMVVAFLFGIVVSMLVHEERLAQKDVRAVKDNAIVLTTGLCAVDGPLGAARYCADWTWVHGVQPFFYRCGLVVVDNKQSIRHLRVAQFATKQEAMAGTHPLNAVSCDMEKRVRADDPKEWGIFPLPTWANADD